ncbi:hypothetical protein ACS0TY_000404 [Phlomoides rotata]
MQVFPESRHRLCLWHLLQNAIGRFGRLKSDDAFKNAFHKCLSGCRDEDEFENYWKEMVTTYHLEDNSWFIRLYGLKEKWCTAFNKRWFSAGTLSSQRSESANHAFALHARKDTTLTEYYGKFKETVKSWRAEEQKDEFKCSRSKPESSLQTVGMINHASEVYTLTLFRDFEKEFIQSLCASYTFDTSLDTTIVYDVKFNGSSNKVTFDVPTKLIKCSCMKFEEYGLLCLHCLRVLHVHSVENIPGAYILKRWTKQAKAQVWDKLKFQNTGKDHTQSTIWRVDMARKYYNLLLLSQDNEVARGIIEESYNRDLNSVKALTRTEEEETSTQSASSRTILDPNRSKTKGRSQRKKNHFERNNRRRTSSTQSAPNLEFGSKTPRPHLI